MHVNNWFLSNRIKINTNKSNFIVYSYRKNILILPDKMNGFDNFIIQTNSSNFLVITIDKHLNFGEHIMLTMFHQKYLNQWKYYTGLILFFLLL